jgi:hypothetical protein
MGLKIIKLLSPLVVSPTYNLHPNPPICSEIKNGNTQTDRQTGDLTVTVYGVVLPKESHIL